MFSLPSWSVCLPVRVSVFVCGVCVFVTPVCVCMWGVFVSLCRSVCEQGPGDASNFDTYPEEPIKWYVVGV